MTPRHDLAFIDLQYPVETLRSQIVAFEHTRLIVCRDGLSHILGILSKGDLLKKTVDGTPVTLDDIEAVLQKPLFIPETVSTIQLMENFRHTRNGFSLIVDEYGEVQGIVTLNDVLAAIIGDYSVPEMTEENGLIRREDGSWLVNGEVGMERLASELGMKKALPGEETNRFHTVGGFVMYMLGKIPSPADHFDSDGWRFEVMNMDKNRVDKVLVTPLGSSTEKKSSA